MVWARFSVSDVDATPTSARPEVSASAAEFLVEPVLTCRAIGTTVVPKDHQRFSRG